LTARKNNGGMGFKDIASFNVAMLGEQGLKFQMDVDRLVTGLFKARCFPNSDFLWSKLGSNPSYVWRSILAQK